MKRSKLPLLYTVPGHSIWTKTVLSSSNQSKAKLKLWKKPYSIDFLTFLIPFPFLFKNS